ncbi:MAG: hypothetical protein P8Y69_01035 [Gammaproteobacteria bacterium]
MRRLQHPARQRGIVSVLVVIGLVAMLGMVRIRRCRSKPDPGRGLQHGPDDGLWGPGGR